MFINVSLFLQHPQEDYKVLSDKVTNY